MVVQDENIWMEHGGKLYCFRQMHSQTEMLNGSKTEFRLTVFNEPMEAAIKAVKLDKRQPGGDNRPRMAKAMFQNMVEIAKNIGIWK